MHHMSSTCVQIYTRYLTFWCFFFLSFGFSFFSFWFFCRRFPFLWFFGFRLLRFWFFRFWLLRLWFFGLGLLGFRFLSLGFLSFGFLSLGLFCLGFFSLGLFGFWFLGRYFSFSSDLMTYLQTIPHTFKHSQQQQSLPLVLQQFQWPRLQLQVLQSQLRPWVPPLALARVSWVVPRSTFVWLLPTSRSIPCKKKVNKIMSINMK